MSPDGARTGEILDGRYRIEKSLGEGGMARVFRARDEALGRTVAIKVFRAGIGASGGADDDLRRESEKTLLASLNHPSLVTLFDARLTGGGDAYLVMEYIDGGTLSARLDAGAVSSADAASLTTDLGEALHVMHAAGIVHRDIKPSNILLRPPLTPEHSFRAVLADFGIAYLVDTTRVTAPGTAVGTAAYISPEQVRGAEPSPASDIYSLGLVLLEALTGRRAFAQQTPVEAIAARLSTPPVIPPDVGPGWRALLTSMTALDPATRPSALDVARRGREQEAGGPAEQVTQAAIVTGDPMVAAAPSPPTAGTPEVPPTPPTGETRVLPSAVVTPPTRELAPNPDAGSVPAGSSGLRARSGNGAPHGRRTWAIAAGAIVIVGALGVGAFIWSSAGGTPSTPPDLPQVEEPLAGHLDDLLEQVTP